ncbi:MAG: transcription termination/antitermination NusG family protein [Pirellulales bacterium]
MSFASMASGTLSFEFDESSPENELQQHPLFFGQAITEHDGRQWWVFYTKSRQEKALAHYLRARRVPHYLPLHERQTISRGRRFRSQVPLFGGYLFLFADLHERITALESNRVARTIDVPHWQHAELCRDLLQVQRLIESGEPLTVESRIQPGQRVRVKSSGRLAGLEGIVTKRRGRSRLLITVNYLQQGASIEIDDFAVEIV